MIHPITTTLLNQPSLSLTPSNSHLSLLHWRRSFFFRFCVEVFFSFFLFFDSVSCPQNRKKRHNNIYKCNFCHFVCVSRKVCKLCQFESQCVSLSVSIGFYASQVFFPRSTFSISPHFSHFHMFFFFFTYVYSLQKHLFFSRNVLTMAGWDYGRFHV